MMSRIICPPKADLPSLRQPLTPGEKLVLEFFDRNLPPKWEIYIQPHMNGLRPDFVLLHPGIGVAVYEVKDWNLDAMRYFLRDSGNGRPQLWAEKDGECFPREHDNPVSKVRRYKDEIYELYCPRLGSNLRDNYWKSWAAVTTGIIFPFAHAGAVRALFAPMLTDNQARYLRIGGMEELARNDIRSILPDFQRQKSYIFNAQLADDLRGWLAEPSFVQSQRTPLTLDATQKRLAETRTPSGYRRIKGPAGSGKSVVLAARAAKLLDEGKNILIATYNITLIHYLRDLIVRNLRNRKALNENATLRNFHSWCKYVCEESGMAAEYAGLFSDERAPQQVLAEEMPLLCRAALRRNPHIRYDAIFVDEGQDFNVLWWNVLREACKPDGEMMLVADATQDIYGTARGWTEDAMLNAGFRGGQWAELQKSYRLPPKALDYARDFARAYLPEDTVDLPRVVQTSLEMYPCNLRWVQTTPQQAQNACVEELLSFMRLTGRNRLANANITFLAEDGLQGADIVAKLERKSIRTVSTFNPDPQLRRHEKMAFYMGNACIKATTLHSFKGWESRLLLICINNADHRNLPLIYAGLTRLKWHEQGSWLTVVNSTEELAAFGATWPESVRLAA